MRSDHTRARLPWSLMAALNILMGSMAPGCLDGIPPDTITRPGTGQVNGTVRESCTGAPLSGVMVTPCQAGDDGSCSPVKGVSTGAGGTFEFSDLDSGSWRLTLSKQGYQTLDRDVAVTSSSVVTLAPALTPVPSQVPATAKLDVLFVVDNSNSMSEEQQRLTEAFPSFMNTLMGYSFVLDLRVGVISTDMGAGNYALPSCEIAGGDGGLLQDAPRQIGCKTPGDDYISVFKTQTNVADDMINNAFTCIARLGTDGCGFEQPLSAVLRAVNGTTNKDFPRTDAALAVVILSDEDDCSATDSSLYNPSQTLITDPLGPLTSFRCFEFGVTCDVNDRTTTGPRKNCKPRASKYMLGIDTFVSALLKGRKKSKVFFAAIAGPANNVTVGISGVNPALGPSCKTATTLAAPAIRLQAVADKLSPNSSFHTICAADLSATLGALASKIANKTIFDPCN